MRNGGTVGIDFLLILEAPLDRQGWALVKERWWAGGNLRESGELPVICSSGLLRARDFG